MDDRSSGHIVCRAVIEVVGRPAVDTDVKVLLPLSLVTLLGAAVWVWLVPQPAAGEVISVTGKALKIERLGHLVSDKHWLQIATQTILTIAFIALNLFCASIMAMGWMGVIFKDPKQPVKSLFPDIMPVGDQVSFTTTPQPEVKPAS